MVWSFDFSSNVTFMVVLHDWEKSPSGVLRGVSFTVYGRCVRVCVCVCGGGGGGSIFYTIYVVNRRQYDVAVLPTLILQLFPRIHLNLKV